MQTPGNWNSSHGDYRRNSEDTNRHYKKLQKKKLVKLAIRVFIAAVLLVAVSYLIVHVFVK